MESTPTVSSFLIRFVQEYPSNMPQNYRGTIRHIQTSQEISFTRWEDAVRFIRCFVPIEEVLINPAQKSDRRE